MWFKRKAKNRRVGREHVLDVKLRAKEVRAARLRLAGTAVALSFGTILGLYLIWRTGEWALDQFVYRNDAFAIRTIDIQTDGIIGVEQLRRWAGVEPGENLLALDLGRIKRDLELVPLIQSAAIDRVLPHSLRIRVVERAPVAQVNVPQLRKGGGIQLATLYLDEKGHVIAPLDAGTPTAQGVSTQPLLPLVFGFKSADLRPGQVVQAPNVNAALKLIMEFENSTMCGLVDLRSVDLSGTAVLQVTTGQESQITFGTDRLPEQLRRWRLVHDLGQKTGRAIRTLDLSVTNNSPVLWAEASAAPPVRSRSVKPARNRKKHV